MSGDLEKIVRPFQETDVFDARNMLPLSTGVDPNDPDFTKWQGGANAQWQEAPWPIANVVYEEDPNRRVTEKVRVENPKDKDQYVMIERIRKMVLVNPGTGDEIPFNMNWDS